MFSNVMFLGDSLWICGWNTNLKFLKNNVFLEVNIPDFQTLTKKKKIDFKSALPTFIFPLGDTILYAKKMQNQVITFYTKSHTFKRRHRSDGLSIAAMCGSEDHVFIFNQNEPTFITVLDTNLRPEGKIPTCLIETEVEGCSFDICLIKSKLSDPRNRITVDHTIVISSSAPHGSVRAVNQTQGVLWQLDCRSTEMLDLTFNPCSVSSSQNGLIFIADQRTGTIYTISKDGEDFQVFLDKKVGIQQQTRVQVDQEGRRLVVIIREGKEIRLYKLNDGQQWKSYSSPVRRSGTFSDSYPSNLNIQWDSSSAVYREQDDEPDDVGLTDDRLLELSKQFVSVLDLREVAIRGLEIPVPQLERHIKGNPANITNAAFDVLRHWRDTQIDSRMAHSKITQALEATNKQFLKLAI